MNIEKILDEQEIVPVFQPIVSLKNCDILGYEICSHLNDKPITEYFEKAEEFEKIWKLEKLCRKSILKKVKLIGLKKNIFININPDIIFDEDFYQGYTLKLLEKFSLEPNQIIFEITENCSQKNEETLSRLIEHYKSQGFRIALDNVGTAYSGLERICVLNPDFIKIDMQIIRNIEKDSLKQSMVKSLTHFSNETGINLVAVGVESANELDFLLSLGVQYAQGYYIGYPAEFPGKVSAESYARIIINQKNNEQLNKKNEKKLIKSTETEKKEKTKDAASNFNFFEQKNETNSRKIEELAFEGVTIFPDMGVPELMNFFTANKECNFVSVIDLNFNILGVMTHSVLSELLGGRFGFGLNYRKTVKDIMITDFFSVDSMESVEDVASKAMKRDEKNLYEPIVVLKNNHYFGIVTIKNLLDTIVSVEVQEKTLEITRKNKLLQNQQRIQERDMKMAELVQKSFYTSKAPCQNNWKSAFVFKPMASVSGDLYDFYFDADKNFVGAGLFDVSGHGVASGLIGILSKYLAEKIFIQNITKPLNKVIQLFSETLAKEKGSVENYLTGVFLRFKENFVEYVNAGHTDVLYKNIKSGKTEVLGDKDGKFRGMFLGMEGLPSDGCSTVSLKVQTGDFIVLYTDCLIESRNINGDDFRLERLKNVLDNSNAKNPKEMIAEILSQFNQFTKGVPLRDDLTIIVLQYSDSE